MKRKNLFIVASVLATFVPATFAVAQLNPRSTAALTKLINQTASKHLGSGYQSPKGPVFGQAENGGVFYKDFTLNPNKNYGFIAVCARPKCADIDLEVFDSLGNSIATDKTDSSEAVVKFKPPERDTYTVEVQMYSCKDPVACDLAMGGYRK